MNKLVTLFSFAIGAAIGSLVTWKLVKTKYEKIAQEEIESVKEKYSKTKPIIVERSHLDDYIDTLKKEDYIDKAKPYRITPDALGDEDYSIASLTYYSDGVLTDDWDNPIEDVEGMVGEENLNHFGEYEEDSIFVRNDQLELDFEILADTRKFSEVAKNLSPPEEITDEE